MDASFAKMRVIFCEANVPFKLNFEDKVYLYAICFFDIVFLFLLEMLSFSILEWLHTYAHSYPNRGSKWTHKSLKKQSHFSKKRFFLRLYFRDKGHLYTKFLLDILTIDPKCHLFQFFSRDMRMYIPILTGVQNRRINLRKNSVILLKNCFVKIYFLR